MTSIAVQPAMPTAMSSIGRKPSSSPPLDASPPMLTVKPLSASSVNGRPLLRVARATV
jgi:hypothetical protein